MVVFLSLIRNKGSEEDRLTEMQLPVKRSLPFAVLIRAASFFRRD